MRTNSFSPLAVALTPRVTPSVSERPTLSSSSQPPSADTFTSSAPKVENRSGVNTVVDIEHIISDLLPALTLFTSDAVGRVFKNGKFEGRRWRVCEVAHDNDFNKSFPDAGRLAIFIPFDESGALKILSIPNQKTADVRQRVIVDLGAIEQKDNVIEQRQRITLGDFELDRVLSLPDGVSTYNNAFDPYIRKNYRPQILVAKKPPLTDDFNAIVQANQVFDKIGAVADATFSKDTGDYNY
jgi:hypothetical protein